jgi:hypothetical protein
MTFMKRCVLVLLAASVAAAVLLTAAGCASHPKTGSARELIAATPAKNLKNYKFDPNAPIAERLQKAPAFVLKYLKEMDGRDDYAAYEPTDAEKQLVLQYLDLLPAWFDAMLKERLVAIYFIENYLGSGMTEFILDKTDKVYAFIAINPATLREGMSEWMTSREKSCFSGASTGAGALDVFVDCGKKYQALLYILAHECGHVADYVYHYTPYTEPAIKELGLGVSKTPFVENIWAEYAKPEERADFPGRGDVTFYGLGGGPKIALANAGELYRSLSNSPFPSLYAAQNWAEDFAECFTWYFFTTRLGQPYRVGIKRGGTVEVEYEPIYWSRVVHRFPQLDSVVQDTRK